MRNNCLYYFLLFLLCVACTTDDSLVEPADSYSVNATILLNDVWSAQDMFSTRAAGDPLYQIYIFGSDDQAIYNRGGYMTKLSVGQTFTNITTPGTYTFYGITNLLSGEYTSTDPSITITSENTFTLDATSTPRDICLGKQQLTVSADQSAYNVSISAAHIMSQLALTVKNVPADVTAITVTLSSQANVFDFTCKFTGNTTSQILTLTKSATANTNGTYTWTCDPTIVFPCATGTTSMPIKITWSSSAVTSKDVNTTSTTCCLSGKNLSLSTTWNEAFRTSAVITTSAWATVEEGTFPW